MMANLLPTKEELEFLQLREQLKQRIRNKRMMNSGYSHDHCSVVKKKLPCDNFGSFFGPSQPAIVERLLIQGSRGLMEEFKINKDKQNLKNTATTTKSGPTDQQKSKCKNLKESRDNSFLLKDYLEVPTTTKKEAGLDDKGSMKNSKCVKKPHLMIKVRHLMPKQASLNHQDPDKCKASLAKSQPSPTKQNIKQAKETTAEGEPIYGKDASANSKNVKEQHLEEKKRHGHLKGPNLMSKQASLKHQNPKKCKASLAKPQSSSTNQNIKQAKETTVVGEPGLLSKDSSTNTKCVKRHQHLEEKERNDDQKGRYVVSKQASLKQQNHPEKCKASLAKPQSLSTNQNIKQAKQSRQQRNSTKVVQPKQKSFLKNEMKRHHVEENLDDDEGDDGAAMVSTFDDIMREERKSAKIARKEDEIEWLRNKQEEKQKKLRGAKKQKLQASNN